MSKSKQELGEGLVMKTAEDMNDIEQVAKLANIIHGGNVAHLCRQLFTNHPNIQPSDLIYVEDENTGEAISTLCLIPWEWKYEDVTLKVGEMGVVATLEPYRNRGLIRKQAEYHRKLLNDGEYDISIIQGIPYFYRQFGYEYAIPIERNCIIEFHQIPKPAENEKSKCAFRLASPDDIPEIEKIYAESVKSLAIHTVRNNAIWQYLFENNPKTGTAFEIWVIEDTGGKTIGYFFIQRYPFGNALTVNEVSKLSYDGSIEVLRHLKELAVEREKPNIRLNMSANCELTKVAVHHGAVDRGSYALQIYIPNVARFLRKIAPVLEKRVADSPFAGLTDDIRISLYREKIVIHFEDGRITDIEELEFSSNWWEPIQLPERAAVPLFLGYRDREESKDFWKDMGAQPKYAYLLDVMFPKMESFIYSIY